MSFGAIIKMIFLANAVLMVLPSLSVAEEIKPPRVDYCKMLERDIEGQHHGFLAGNKLYYVAGMSPAEWDHMFETETIGFTHPIFRDGRARGFGIVEEEATGTGHDCWGWDFYRHNKGAYGTVIVDGEQYKHPKANETLWRPDRQITTYSVGGANIREEKFISGGDVLTDIITSDKDIEILFEGESFVCGWKLPGFDGDDTSQPFNRGNNSRATFKKRDNVLHLEEDATTYVKPQFKQPVVLGKTMYSGLSFLFSADAPMQDVTISKDPKRGNLLLSFRLTIPAGQPVALTYAVADKYGDALAATKNVLKDPAAALDEKSSAMNSLLNEQIPYFRCSDDMAVQTYYYLWSLYFMYFRDIGEGYLKYPHTQTAINNFMGLHLWDSWAYTQAGSWVADKWAYGHGNILSWQFMVPFKNKGNLMPDNFGKAWQSMGAYMGFAGAVEPAWQQYRRSGDKVYLREVYTKLFRPLYKDNNGPTQTFGIEINAINTLQKMALELGLDHDLGLWEEFRDRNVRNFKHQWSGQWDGFYGGKNTPWKDIWALVALQSDLMSKEWGREMIDKYVMDTEVGFMSPVGINTRAADDPPNGIFRCSTISLWLGVDGMFRQRQPYPAMLTILNHIKGMTREWGYPVAPEAWAEKHEAWGSRYYNWDIALVCPMLEWMAGIDYSIPDKSFTAAPHLPPSWNYIETYTPIVLDGKKHWVRSRAGRRHNRRDVDVEVTIEGSPFDQNYIRINPDNRKLVKAKGDYHISDDDGALCFDVEKSGKEIKARATFSERKIAPYKTLAWVTPRTRIFHGAAQVKAENLTPGTVLRYTSDGSEPTAQSPLYPDEGITLNETTALIWRAYGDDGATYLPFKLTFEDTPLQDAVEINPEALTPGLDYVAYEIEKRKSLPDFSALKEIGRGEISRTSLGNSIDLQSIKDAIGRDENFALLISGYLSITDDQVYNIFVASDDGSRLLIDGTEVINLDSNSELDPWFKDGYVGLKKGYHKVDIYYYQAHSRTHLQYKMRPGNKFTRKPISGDLWSRLK